MRTKLILAQTEGALDRLLDALASELGEATDEEILEAAKELGMNPLMKGSAAFLGLRIPPAADFMQWAEFFGSEEIKSALAGLNLKSDSELPALESKPPKSRRAKRPTIIERKH
jgi:hypothetical protein